jgi:tetratricopeptide (TPR) repeat protein
MLQFLTEWLLLTGVTPRIRALGLGRDLTRTEGERQLKAGNYVDAEKYLALAVAERRHPVPKTELLLFLAEAQRRQGKLAEAERTVRTALEHTARLSDSSGYVQSLDALAEVFHDGRKFAAMEQILQQGIRIEATLPHPDSLRMARRVYRLGIARHQSGHSEEAIPPLEKAAALHQQLYGEDHRDTADLLSDLGAIYRATGRSDEAQRCFRRALRIHEKLCGRDSLQTLRDRINLAGSLEESGGMVKERLGRAAAAGQAPYFS